MLLVWLSGETVSPDSVAHLLSFSYKIIRLNNPSEVDALSSQLNEWKKINPPYFLSVEREKSSFAASTSKWKGNKEYLNSWHLKMWTHLNRHIFQNLSSCIWGIILCDCGICTAQLSKSLDPVAPRRINLNFVRAWCLCREMRLQSFYNMRVLTQIYI